MVLEQNGAAFPAITEAQVRVALARHLPGAKILAVEDRGAWCRRIFRATLADDRVLVVKVHIHPEWDDSGAGKERIMSELLLDHGLPAPRVLAVDNSRAVIPGPYVIQEFAGGTRLSDLLGRVGEEEKPALYEAVGRFYQKLHAIHNDRSGWMDGSGTIYPAPNDHMYQSEVVERGKEAVERGLLSEKTYRRLTALYEKNLPYLKDHRPTLMGSVFRWAIYLERDGGGGWRVAKLMDLGDLLYWDHAHDLAGIKYPAFGEYDERLWQAFLAGYGPAPEEKRLKLHLLQQRLTASLGYYMEPAAPGNAAWRKHCLDDLDRIMDEIEAGRES